MGGFTHYGCGPSDAWETHTAPAWAAGTQWHEWSVEWTPSKLVYKVDGVVWGEVNDSSRIPHEHSKSTPGSRSPGEGRGDRFKACLPGQATRLLCCSRSRTMSS